MKAPEVLCLLTALHCGAWSCAAPRSHSNDADLRQQMQLQWKHPERKNWQIEYRPINGAEGEHSWHVADTMFWVRIYPDVYSLEDLDKNLVHEIDAVALAQNYGVIDFYIYSHPRVVSK